MESKLDFLLSKTGDISLRRRARWILQNLDLKKGLKILDVGCGDGYYLHLLRGLNMNLKLCGVDSDKKALQSAGKNLKGEKVRLIYGKAEKLPLTNNSFERIIASEVLEHTKNDSVVAKEILRVLKPNGILVVSVPNLDYPFMWDPVNWMLQHFFNTHIESGFWAGIWNQHIRLYSEEKLLSVFERVGFKKILIRRLTHFCLPFNHYLVNIVARFLARTHSQKSKRMLNKFSPDVKGFSLFSPIFLFDRLNDFLNGNGSSVSLVAKAMK